MEIIFMRPNLYRNGKDIVNKDYPLGAILKTILKMKVNLENYIIGMPLLIVENWLQMDGMFPHIVNGLFS